MHQTPVASLLLDAAAIPASLHAALFDEHPQIAHRGDLDIELIRNVFARKKKPSADVSEDLLDRRFTDEDLVTFAAAERRQRPLLALTHANAEHCGPEGLSALLGTGNAKVVKSLVELKRLRYPELIEHLGTLSAKDAMAALLEITPDQLDDTGFAVHLLTVLRRDWKTGLGFRFNATAALLHARPGLFQILLADPQCPEPVLTSAAGSPLLVGQDLQDLLIGGPDRPLPTYATMALVNNPTATPATRIKVLEVVSRLDDQDLIAKIQSSIDRVERRELDPLEVHPRVAEGDMLSWLWSRASGTAERPTGRPHHMMLLAGNLHLDPRQRALAVNTVAWPADTFPEWWVDEVRDRLIGAYPDEARRLTQTDDGHRDNRPGYQPDPAQEAERIARQAANAPARQVHTLPWAPLGEQEAALALLSDAAGDDEGAWRLLLTMADEFKGTVEELRSFVSAVSAST